MQPQRALALHTELTLPLIPFAIDTCARWLILRARVEWFQIPDLVVLLATFSFFCLGLMFGVSPRALPTDPEVNATVELVRQRLLGYAIFAVALAGGISFFRAFDEMYPEHHLYIDNGLYLSGMGL